MTCFVFYTIRVIYQFMECCFVEENVYNRTKCHLFLLISNSRNVVHRSFGPYNLFCLILTHVPVLSVFCVRQFCQFPVWDSFVSFLCETVLSVFCVRQFCQFSAWDIFVSFLCETVLIWDIVGTYSSVFEDRILKLQDTWYIHLVSFIYNYNTPVCIETAFEW